MGAYFDNNATTPLDPRVRDAMLPFLGPEHGNPSSGHHYGRSAREAVEEARSKVAALLGAAPEEVLFTASGTEGNNQVVFSVARRAGFRGHLVTTALEHPSILAAASRVALSGMEVTEIPPGPDGAVPPEAVEEALRDDTRLVCLMLANNELGTLQPVARVAEICRERGVPVLCDAVQAVGKVPVHVEDLGVDFLTLGGHKFHAPLGSAALWTRRGRVAEPLLVGGGQEGGRRSGTENVPAIVGLGRACELAAQELGDRRDRLMEMRAAFERALPRIEGAVVHAAGALRLPHTSHVAFPGVFGHELMQRLDEAGFTVSTGSACFSGKPQPSRTLLAMGISEEEALSSLRVSFGILNTMAEVEAFVEVLCGQVCAMRAS